MRVVDLLAGLVVVFCVLVYYGYGIGWTAAWIPVLFLGQLTLGLGLGLPLAALNLFFHDIRFLVEPRHIGIACRTKLDRVSQATGLNARKQVLPIRDQLFIPVNDPLGIGDDESRADATLP